LIQIRCGVEGDEGTIFKISIDCRDKLQFTQNNDCYFNSGLSFGRVDQLGRFQSDIEPDPDRVSGKHCRQTSRISSCYAFIKSNTGEIHKFDCNICYRIQIIENYEETGATKRK
jgi:hypothetical protein